MSIELIIETEEKRCPDCLGVFPTTEEYFYKQKHHSKKKGTYYKLSTYCKKCTKSRNTKYQQENPEVHNNSQKKYLYTTEKGRETRRRNLDKWISKGGYKEYQLNNKDKFAEYGKHRREHKTHDITDQEWFECKEFFKFSCSYCGLSEVDSIAIYGQQLHKEHVEHTGANDITNCVPACKSCNGLKNTFELNEWYNSDNLVYSKRRYNKIIKWLLSFAE